MEGRTVIGVLALQGDFAEHACLLAQLGAEPRLIRHAPELEELDGLIIPGGESTTIARLAPVSVDQSGGRGADIFSAICRLAAGGLPIYGTCMGTVLLARHIEGSLQGRLGLMDIAVRRNAFGPQKFSFERWLNIPLLGENPFPAVFIRAPVITSSGPGVDVLASTTEGIVMARQGHLLATAFHPEITGDPRIHNYFLDMVRSRVQHSAVRAARVRHRTVKQPQPMAGRTEIRGRGS